MKKIIALLLVLVVIMGVSISAYAVENDNEKKITICLFQVPPTLDTGTVNEFNATRTNACIYDYLVDKDVDGNWIPSVATSWKQVDSLTWEFEISDQFVFQNGEPLTMDDIVYSWERLCSAPAASLYANGVASATYEGQTLTLTLKEADNSIIPQLVNGMFIINKKYVEEKGSEALNTAPIGTGPYAVTFYDPSTKAVLHTWDGYPFEKPDIDEITIIAGADYSARYIQLETGAAQFTGTLGYLDAQRAIQDDRFVEYEYPDIGVAAIKFNVAKAPFNNKDVREALACALDRETFCYVAQGCVPAYSMIAASEPEYCVASTLPQYDLERAMELLAAAGYSASNPLEFSVTTFMNETALEAYQSILASIGVKMTINAVDSGAYTEAESSGSYDALYSRYVNRSGSAMEEVNYYVSRGNKNTTGYKNDRVDEIGKTILSSTDQDEIQALFKELQEIAAADVHMLPIMTPHSWFAAVKELDNVTLLPNGLFRAEEFRLP